MIPTSSKNIKQPDFTLDTIPTAFFCDNPSASATRNQLIKNQVRINSNAPNILPDIFFSDENIHLINQQLIYLVYKKTNGEIKISPQSKASLTIVMRYIFIEFARHLPWNIPGQVKDLNCRVVGEILPKIITEATQRIDYLKTISTPRALLPLPINVQKSHRELPSVSSILFP
jgi:hypothetical protein